MQGKLIIEIENFKPEDKAKPSVHQQIAHAFALPTINDHQVPHYDRNGNLITSFVSHKQVNRTRVVTGYIDDTQALLRSNLTIQYNTTAYRIIFDDSATHSKRAIAVETHDGKRYYASKEIVINCGAIMSPTLLMRSGIGNTPELARVGVDTRVHSPGVGKNLADHTGPILEAFSTRSITNYGKRSNEVVKVAIKTHPQTFHNWPDFDLNIYCAYDTPSQRSIVSAIAYDFLCPVSGVIRLRSADPTVAPEIDGVHDVFDDKGNLRADLIPSWLGVYRTWLSLCKKLHGTLLNSNLPEVTQFVRNPDGSIKLDPSDDEILESYKQALKSTPDSINYKTRLDKGHFMGSCRMGNRDRDPLAVVDHEFKVYGTENLRIIDNSIVPSTPDGKLVVGPFWPSLRLALYVRRKSK